MINFPTKKPVSNRYKIKESSADSCDSGLAVKAAATANVRRTSPTFISAMTATGSVALQIAPKKSAISQSHPYGNINLAKTAVIVVVATNPGPASINTYFIFADNSGNKRSNTNRKSQMDTQRSKPSESLKCTVLHVLSMLHVLSIRARCAVGGELLPLRC